MKRIGFLLKVRSDRLEEYRQHHKKVWPEMIAALKRTGWNNYSLFLKDDGYLFGYFETPESFQSALDGMEKEAINEKWQAMTAPYFEALDGKRPDEGMIALEEVFHID